MINFGWELPLLITFQPGRKIYLSEIYIYIYLFFWLKSSYELLKLQSNIHIFKNIIS